MKEKKMEKGQVRETKPVDTVAPGHSRFPDLHIYPVGRLIEMSLGEFSGPN